MSDVMPITDHIPSEEWPDVTKMLEGFGDPSLPASEALVGQVLSVNFDDGLAREFSFVTGTELEYTGPESAEQFGTKFSYRAVEVRRGIFYIDFLIGSGAHAHNCSLVYAASDGVVTFADSHMYNVAGTIRTATQFHHGGIATAGEFVARERSNALVGLRIYYRYSPVEHYEHIYLSPGTFVWHCINGGERGLQMLMKHVLSSWPMIWSFSTGKKQSCPLRVS